MKSKVVMRLLALGLSGCMLTSNMPLETMADDNVSSEGEQQAGTSQTEGAEEDSQTEGSEEEETEGAIDVAVAAIPETIEVTGKISSTSNQYVIEDYVEAQIKLALADTDFVKQGGTVTVTRTQSNFTYTVEFTLGDDAESKKVTAIYQVEGYDTDIYEPTTGLVLSPSVVSENDGKSVSELVSGERRPSTVIRTVSGDMTVTDNGKQISISTYVKNANKKTLVGFRIENIDVAKKFAEYVKENNLVDIMVVSKDKDILKAACNGMAGVRGMLDCSEYDSNTALIDLISMTNESNSRIIVLPQELATEENIEYIQARAVAVWVKADKDHVLETILNGAEGIFTEDSESVYDVIESFGDSTKVLTRDTVITAHRGFHEEAPENTERAAKLAVEAGADTIECDIYLTKDGEVVINHDDDTGRLMYENVNVSESTLAELQALKFDPEKVIGATEEDRIPTLRQLFEAADEADPDDDIIHVIEIKTSDTAVIEPMVKVIKDMHMEDRVVFISFFDYQLDLVREAMPGVGIGELNSLCSKSDTVSSALQKLSYRMDGYGYFYNCYYGSQNLDLVKAGRFRGLYVHPWTVNDQTEFETEYINNYHGITTNRTDHATHYLNKVETGSDAYKLVAGNGNGVAIDAKAYERSGAEIEGATITMKQISGTPVTWNAETGVCTAETEGEAVVLFGASYQLEATGETYTVYSAPVTLNVQAADNAALDDAVNTVESSVEVTGKISSTSNQYAIRDYVEAQVKLALTDSDFTKQGGTVTVTSTNSNFTYTATFTLGNVTKSKTVKAVYQVEGYDADIYEAKTGLVLSPSVVSENDGKTVAELVSGERRPSTVMRTVSENLTVTDNGEEIDIKTYVERADKKTLVGFRIESKEVAEKFAAYAEANNLVDIMVVSKDKDVLKAACNGMAGVRGMLDCSDYDSSKALIDLISMTNESNSRIIVLPQSLATEENINYIQARAVAVWVEADNDHVLDVILNGAEGIFTTDSESVYDVIESFEEGTSVLTRNTVITAHRGFHEEAPENTERAAKLAVEAGADTIECDVYLTSDGEVVINHDDDTGRLMNENLVVSESTLAELQALKFTKDDTATSEDRIPTLRQLFEAADEADPDDDIIHVIEIKTSDPAVIDPMVKVIKDMHMEDRVVFISFFDYQLDLVREAMPGVAVGELNSVCAKKDTVSSALQKLAYRMDGTGYFYNCSYSKQNLDLVKAGRYRGLYVHPWTVNDQTEFETEYINNYHGITTNRTDHATHYLNEVETGSSTYKLAAGDANGITIDVKAFERSGAEIEDATITMKQISGTKVTWDAEKKICTACEAGEAVVLFGATYTLPATGKTYTVYSAPVTLQVQGTVEDALDKVESSVEVTGKISNTSNQYAIADYVEAQVKAALADTDFTKQGGTVTVTRTQSNFTYTAALTLGDVTKTKAVKAVYQVAGYDADIYEPTTGLVLSPSVVSENDGKSIPDLVSGERRPSTVIRTVSGDMTVMDNGRSISISSYAAKANNKTLVGFRIENMDVAKKFAEYVKKNNLTDIMVVSKDKDILKTACNGMAGVRGMLDCSGYDSNTALIDLISMTNESNSRIIVLPQELATEENIEYIQARAVAVWVKADNDHVLETILNGAEGIFTEDSQSVYDVIESFGDSTKVLTRNTVITAHRGFHVEAPENTERAAKLAVEAGADTIECDIYLTKDGEVVINHDDDTGRLMYENVNVSESTLAELQALKFDPEKVAGATEEDRIPTLRQLFEAADEADPDDDVIHVIEIKTSDPAVIEPMVKVIKDMHMEDRVVFISFFDYQLDLAREAMPGVAVGELNSVCSKADTVSSALQKLSYRMDGYGYFYNCYYGAQNLDLVKAGRFRGLYVHPWTVNDQTEFETEYINNYHGITTNRIDHATHYLNEVETENTAYTLYAGDKNGVVINAKAYERSGAQIENAEFTLKQISGTPINWNAETGTITADKSGEAVVLVGASYELTAAGESYTIYSAPITVKVQKNQTTLPAAAVTVENTVKKVADVTLPAGWTWKAEDAAKALVAGGSVEVTAEYTGADKESYDVTSQKVTITRNACVGSDVLFTGVGEKVPTCGETGVGHKECTVCGDILAAGVVVEKSNAHTWDAGVVTTEATVAANGVKTYTCTTCHTTKTEAINALGLPAKNTIISDAKNQAQYKVTASNATSKAVQYVAPTSKTAKTITIPATITVNGVTYKVTSIANNAFKNNKTITKVTIGSNVKTIGDYAFYGCTKLKTVTFSKNVTTIGNKAFYKCTALTKVTIPCKVTKIGTQAFYGCKNLKTITINTTKLAAKKVGSNAFKGINGKAAIKVPKTKVNTYKTLLKQKGIKKTVTVK